MHASAFLLGAISLAATTAATPLHKFRINAATVANYTWTVTDWEASCAEDCTYSFNVSAPAFKTSVPAFNASCAGTGIGASYAVCKGPAAGQAVAAKLLPASTNETAKLAVSYEFLDPNAVGTQWNYTSFASQPYGSGLSFDVTPTEVWGAA